MLNKVLALICFTLSLSTNAATISYNSYTLDTDTNIVTGGGLEWLQWDVTVTYTILEALDTYSADGWRLATNVEVTDLFNAFLKKPRFIADEDTEQDVYLTLKDLSVVNFIEVFGETYETGGTSSTGAYYGYDADNDSRFNRASVLDYDVSRKLDDTFSMSRDFNLYSLAGTGVGVALVRGGTYVTPPSLLIPPPGAVPVPAAIWLFGSGLIGLIVAARRK